MQSRVLNLEMRHGDLVTVAGREIVFGKQEYVELFVLLGCLQKLH